MTKFDDDVFYKLTAKGCAIVSMLDADLIDDMEDERVTKFWRRFQSLMLMNGYAVITDEEEEE